MQKWVADIMQIIVSSIVLFSTDISLYVKYDLRRVKYLYAIFVIQCTAQCDTEHSNLL